MIDQDIRNDQPDSFTDDLIGVSSYETQKPSKKEFLPWHRPRKQFVRHKQWSRQIMSLLEALGDDNTMLTYLGLPGDDLLDLRFFHDTICVPLNLKLKYLGFNKGVNTGSDHEAEIEISLDEVNKLSNIDISSHLLGDDITQIAIERSIAWDHSVKMGPFDVINLDLCDGFAKHPVGHFKETHFNSLSRLFSVQARRLKPWLLLITTRTDRECIDQDVFERLQKLYQDNLQRCDGFFTESKSLFSVDSIETLHSYSQSSKGISDIFLISLSKWLASIVVDQVPPSNLELKSVIGYKVAQKAESLDMISIAIRITPKMNSSADRVGLVTNSESGVNECLIAKRIVKRVHRQLDVDQILLDPELLEEMIKSSISLLEKARYNVDEYRNWIQRGS